MARQHPPTPALCVVQRAANKKNEKNIPKNLVHSFFLLTFASANKNWCVSSAWLECLPVTQEVTGSSPVRTAGSLPNRKASCFLYIPQNTLVHEISPPNISLSTKSPPNNFLSTNDTNRTNIIPFVPIRIIRGQENEKLVVASPSSLRLIREIRGSSRHSQSVKFEKFVVRKIREQENHGLDNP